MSVKKRGFGSMDKSRQREIASRGGKMAHRRGTAFQWTSEQATAAGRKGGLARNAKRLSALAETPSPEPPPVEPVVIEPSNE